MARKRSGLGDRWKGLNEALNNPALEAATERYGNVIFGNRPEPQETEDTGAYTPKYTEESDEGPSSTRITIKELAELAGIDLDIFESHSVVTMPRGEYDHGPHGSTRLQEYMFTLEGGKSAVHEALLSMYYGECNENIEQFKKYYGDFEADLYVKWVKKENVSKFAGLLLSDFIKFNKKTSLGKAINEDIHPNTTYTHTVDPPAGFESY